MLHYSTNLPFDQVRESCLDRIFDLLALLPVVELRLFPAGPRDLLGLVALLLVLLPPLVLVELLLVVSTPSAETRGSEVTRDSEFAARAMRRSSRSFLAWILAALSSFS